MALSATVAKRMAETRSISERLATLPPGRHLVPHDFVVQNQRERMLLATAELVAERGYRRTTIELIAKTARVALTTFYEHFESKEECFLAAFDENVDAAAEVFVELVDPELDWTDQISTGLEVFLEMVATETPRATLCIVESQAAGPAALARYQGMLERVAPKLREGRALNPRSARLPEGLEMALAGRHRLARPPAPRRRGGGRDQGAAAGDAPDLPHPVCRRSGGGPRGRRRSGPNRRLNAKKAGSRAGRM